MLKRSIKHNIYEIWCEHAAESVFIDHKPSKSELEEIRQKEWPINGLDGNPLKLKAFKLEHYYVTYTPLPYVKPPPKVCTKCQGHKYVYSGNKLFDAYRPCQTCKGKGIVE